VEGALEVYFSALEFEDLFIFFLPNFGRCPLDQSELQSCIIFSSPFGTACRARLLHLHLGSVLDMDSNSIHWGPCYISGSAHCCILWSEPFLDTQLPAAKPFWMDCLRGSLDGVPYYLLFWIPLWTGPIGSPWTLMNLPFGHLSGYASVLERRTGIFTVRASSLFYSVLMFLLKVLFLSPKGTPGSGVRFKRGLSV
jgi:hypothetical protein